MTNPNIQESRNNEITRQGLTKSEILNSNQVSERIIKILEEDPEKKTQLYETLKNDLIKTIISNPTLVGKVLEALDQKFQERMASNEIEPKDRINSIKNYTKLIAGIGHQLAEATLNISWDNELNDAKREFDKKNNSLTSTYGSILNDLHNSVTQKTA